MSHSVEVRQTVQRKLVSWNLPDSVFVEAHLQLREDLPKDPHLVLRRQKEPFDGMVFEMSMIDPENRFCLHTFLFHVVYATDEMTLIIVNGKYIKDSL